MKRAAISFFVALLMLGNLYQWNEGTASASEPASPSLDAPDWFRRPVDEILERCHLLWNRNPQGSFANLYQGVRTLQNPLDAWITQEILYELKPDFVVETGTYHGGSAVLWAAMLQHVNPGGRVITIDLHDQTKKVKELPLWKSHVDFLVGSSTDPKIVKEVAQKVAGKKVLVILDSLHTREHVKAELEAYAPLIDKGGYIIVQDTLMDRFSPELLAELGFERIQKEPGAGAGVAAFLASNSDFEIDKKRERFVFTSNWNGFLRRVR